MNRVGARHVPAGLAVLALVPALFLVAPLGALLWRSVSPGQWALAARAPMLGQAVRLSLATTGATLAAVLVFGTPLAYLLARHQFPAKGFLDTLVDLPMVLPPAVAGLALLMTFGRKGLAGPLVEALGAELAFSTAAVVMAQTFVSAPFYIRAARIAFESVDPELEEVAATMGATGWTIFWRVTVPMAFPGLLGGAVTCWARALGEFGATILFAGNFPGRTQTMPLAIYTAMEGDVEVALTLALFLLGLSWAVLVCLRLLSGRLRGHSSTP